MKKGYIKPQMVVVELENEGMLCTVSPANDIESGGQRTSGSAEAPSYKLPEGPDLWSDDSLW